jgi:hypothetical protein
MPARSPAGDRPITASLKARIEALQTQLAKLETGERGRGGVGSPGRAKSRYHHVRLVSVAAGVGLLPFAPVDWVDIVDAAPIPLAFDLRATRHRQMIEQAR